MEIGTVVSLEGTPNTYEYLFVIKKENSKEVKKGIYVYSENEQGNVFGYLQDIERANRYLENPEAVADYGSEKLSRHFPLNKWDYLLARVNILGVLKEKDGKYVQEKAALPPIPGSKVFKAKEEMLKLFFGVDEEGLSLGNIYGHDIELRVNITRMFQKHLAILAMSGAGKSNLTKVILEELLKREKKKVSAVVFDIHGEYVGLTKLSKRVKLIEAKDIKIPARFLDTYILNELFPDMSGAQYGVYNKIMSSFPKDELIDLDDIIEALRASQYKQNVKEVLERYLEELKTYHIIGKVETPSLQTLIKPGDVVVFNLIDISNVKKINIIAYYMLKRLFNMRKKSIREGKKIIPPLVCFIEEAHNLAPQNVEKGRGMAKREIEKIAREGRKFNIGLCLITQRPSHLSQTAISQCNSQIILRITNPNDHSFILQTAEQIDSRTLKEISSLGVGEGVIMGEAVKAPVFVKFRESKAGKTSISKTMEEEAEEFEKEEEDITDAYL